MPWVYRPDHPEANENGMVDARIAGPRNPKHGEAAYVISDDLGAGMKGLRHMATGRRHDSKSAFRADTRASGCQEMGNDVNFNPGPRKFVESKDVGNRREALAKTIYQLKNG